MTQSQDQPFGADPRVDTILDILAKETGIDRAALRPDATMEALAIASLDLITAVFELESTFDIEIPVNTEHAGAEFGTVGDLVAHVLAAIEKQAPNAVPRKKEARPATIS
jgi:acyl carrier protein